MNYEYLQFKVIITAAAAQLSSLCQQHRAVLPAHAYGTPGYSALTDSPLVTSAVRAGLESASHVSQTALA